jgi:hypothetical protein
LLFVVGFALVAAACNNPTYSRNTVERDLRDESGLTPAQAECVAMRLEETIGVERLGARDEPTTREREKLHAALVFAALACGSQPYDPQAAARVLRDKARMPPAYADCLAREFPNGVEGPLPDASVAWRGSHVRALQVAILDATIECAQARGANVALEVRRNLGVSRQQSTCILASKASTSREAFVACTRSTPTTTTTVPATTVPPPSTSAP